MIGLFLCCQEVGKVMKKQSKGIILNISSIYGIQGSDQRIYGNSKLNTPSFYALTKGGMVNFTRYLAAYWNRKGIRVNTLSPGTFPNISSVSKEDSPNVVQDNSFIEMLENKCALKRVGKPEDLSSALEFLCSDNSRLLNGENIVVDGGWSTW